jgi:hypothetical protein
MKNYYDEPPPLRTVIHHEERRIESAVTIPFLQAAISAILAGIAAGVITALLGWQWWKIAGAVTAVVALYSWLSFRSRWAYVAEKVLGIDIDQDGYIGSPPPEALPPVRVELLQNEGRQADFIDLPATPDQLQALADGLQTGRQFALTSFAGQGKPFTRPEFEQLRAELIRRGLAAWRNQNHPGQGCELTKSGRAVMRRFCSEATQRRLPPPPPAHNGMNYPTSASARTHTRDFDQESGENDL